MADVPKETALTKHLPRRFWTKAAGAGVQSKRMMVESRKMDFIHTRRLAPFLDNKLHYDHGLHEIPLMRSAG